MGKSKEVWPRGVNLGVSSDTGNGKKNRKIEEIIQGESMGCESECRTPTRNGLPKQEEPVQLLDNERPEKEWKEQRDGEQEKADAKSESGWWRKSPLFYF